MKRFISLVLLASLVSATALAGNSVNNPPATGGGGGGAPTTATYITQTPDGTLSAEQALSALSTGPMFSTTTTGIVTTLTTLTGLTSTSSALTVNLTTGLAGGQTVVGGTGAGEGLVLSSTTNASKGPITFGVDTGMVYVQNSGILRMGTATAYSLAQLHVSKSTNTLNVVAVVNSSAGGAAQTGLGLGQADTFSGSAAYFTLTGSGFTTSGSITAGSYVAQLSGGSGNSIIRIFQANGDFIVMNTTSDTERFRIANTGAVTFASTTTFGAFGVAAVAQQTVGAITNSVTSGGTSGTIANFTDLTIYANDAAAIRNDIYQLARSVSQDHTALRNLGFGAGGP